MFGLRFKMLEKMAYYLAVSILKTTTHPNIIPQIWNGMRDGLLMWNDQESAKGYAQRWLKINMVFNFDVFAIVYFKIVKIL